MPEYRGLKHSIWDRLLDPREIRQELDEIKSQEELERLKDEIRRDLEWLLNTRLAESDLHKGMDYLKRSLLNFGLIDMNSLRLANPADRNRLHANLEQAIRDFEPRLRDVHVQAELINPGNVIRAIRFQIDAKLRTTPVRRIEFDTTLELSTGAFSIKRDRKDKRDLENNPPGSEPPGPGR